MKCQTCPLYACLLFITLNINNIIYYSYELLPEMKNWNRKLLNLDFVPHEVVLSCLLIIVQHLIDISTDRELVYDLCRYILTFAVIIITDFGVEESQMDNRFILFFTRGYNL